MARLQVQVSTITHKVMQIEFKNINENYKKLDMAVQEKKSCSIFGVQNSIRPILSVSFGKKIIFFVSDSLMLRSRVEEFEMMGKKTFFIDAVQDNFLYKRSGSNELFLSRTVALSKILTGDYDVIVVSIQSLFSFLPNVREFKNHIKTLKVNQKIDMLELEKFLISAGYKKEELIFGMGQFSRRGDVFDIFPISADEPFRIEFFDTVIESIKVLDLQTQRGTKNVDKIQIYPFTDLFLSDEKLKKIMGNLEKFKQKLAENQGSSILSVAGKEVDEVISRLSLGGRDFCLDLVMAFLDDNSSIFDFLHESKKDYLIVFDECKQVYDSFKNFFSTQAERLQELKNDGTLVAGNNPCGFSEKECLNMLKSEPSVAFLKLTNSNKFFESDAVFSFKTSPVSRYVHNLRELSNDTRAFLLKNFKVIIFAGSASNVEQVKNLFLTHGIEISNEKLEIRQEFIQSGFILQDDKLFVVGTYDIFPKKQNSNKLAASRQNMFSAIKVGDYVVHHHHGIGICEGVTKLTSSLGTKDYLMVRYAGGDILYVPTTNLDMLERFSGAQKPTKLSKIGGQDFSNVKNKVKASIKKLAINLVELYAKRESLKGFAFSEDTSLQREFERAFPHTETEDQLSSIDEIKKDMESPKVMDRLVCGDVGFGKTEVALRACFKAICDGKQVAFVAPTTILSEQHYNTARARMQDYGVNIEVLNRFKTIAQTKKILKDLEEGKIDLIFGTHKIFGKNVIFKNLGLIVLDEEQKFGVEHKESLKAKYPNVDVLTLSATPIPRTLSMSLSGIRDISIISTPPSERLPIQTYVVEFSESLVKDAVTRELMRDGQVFILFNSVDKIYSFADKIKAIVPSARILVAHGQMNSKILEQTIYDFYHKKADILICTTIIENGIDIENANTLIVYDSDKLGLSSLYQIRGRVGRGTRMAYAYFTYNSGKVLTEEAYRRLDAMSEFCEFGSGFKLAMRDLEIRGGGEMFGAEQSGHMQKIGYDLYSKMLADSVNEIQGKETEETKDVLVKVALDAFVSEQYISTSEGRMTAYKRISNVSGVEDESKLLVELADTYGKVPEEVKNLIKISLVRNLSRKFGAEQIESRGEMVVMLFGNAKAITESEIFGEAIYRFKLKCGIDFSKTPMIYFKKNSTVKENFEDLRDFLLVCDEIHEKLGKN